MYIQLGAKHIIELGGMISNELKNNGVTLPFRLEVKVNSKDFMKIDEDLYYRSRNDTSGEFIPSQEKIIITIDGGEIDIIESGS